MFEIDLFAAMTRCMRAAVLCVAGRRTRCRGCAQADQLGVPAAQAIKYLRFAAIHRNVNIKDLDAEIRDFVDSRVPEDDTFSSEDVRELFESLKTTVSLTSTSHRQLPPELTLPSWQTPRPSPLLAERLPVKQLLCGVG